MVSVNSDVKNFEYLSNFGKSEYYRNTLPINANQNTLTDSFISATKTQEEIDITGSWLKRNFGITTAAAPLLMAYFYDLFQIGKVLSSKLPKTQFKQLAGKSLRNGFIATASGAILTFVMNKYFNSKTDRNYDKLKKDFNEINTDTNAKLADKMICSNLLAALYNPVSGQIQFNKNVVNDPILSRRIDKKIKHELVHAKQYETVARSQDGIKKVNFATVCQMKNNIEQKNLKSGFDAIYDDIKNNGDKYNNVNIKINGGSAEVNLKDYIEAIHTVLNNPDATYNDIPMVINAEHYQEVIDKKGMLLPEEEIKADEYYKAMLDYKPVSFFASLNPWSDYRQNLLEKEAYRENPSIITRLSNVFSK